jgi:O-acetyl-ADP-ribose deacetylase (regulator of RNase III)
MPELTISIKTGGIAEQKVQGVVNSANSFLLMDSGTAEQLRKAGGSIEKGTKEYEAYLLLVDDAKGVLRDVLKTINRKREPSIIETECLKLVIESNGSAELPLGCSVITGSGNISLTQGNAKFIAHAIAITKNWSKPPNFPAIKATKDSVRRSLINSFEALEERGCVSVAIPVMCTRIGGLSKEESTGSTLRALDTLNRRDSKIREVSIVLYNAELAKDIGWFRTALKK